MLGQGPQPERGGLSARGACSATDARLRIIEPPTWPSVEYAWPQATTGAPGSLLGQKAESVLAVPIARVLDTGYWEWSPYVTWINKQTTRDHESRPCTTTMSG